MIKAIKTVFSAFGMSGKVFHGPLLNAIPEFEISGIIQRSKRDASDMYPDAQIFRNLAEAIEEIKPELVVVNTPPFLHFEEAKTALRSGCHVVVEKPFATNLSEAKSLIEIAKKEGKMLTAFQNRRFDSDFLTVKKLKESGKLGEWTHFESHFDRYRPTVDVSWKENSMPGSGLVWNLGPHLIDQALQLFGFPDAVTAFLRKIRPGSRVEDNLHIILHYPNLVAELKASYLVSDPGLKYKIQGSLFSFQKDGIDIQENQLKMGISPLSESFGIEDHKFRGEIRKQGDQGLEIEPFENERGNYLLFYKQVFECIRCEGKAPVLENELMNMMRVIECVFESNQKRETIDFIFN